MSADKDFAQCVRGDHTVVLDRHRNRIVDEQGVVSRFEIGPRSVPDWLALVGDAADGIPGIPGWGPRSATAVLQEFVFLERIPLEASTWHCALRHKEQLAATLRAYWEDVLLFKRLASLRQDVPLPQQGLGELVWTGVDLDVFSAFCERLGFDKLFERAAKVFRSGPAQRCH